MNNELKNPEILKNVPIFKGLSDEELLNILNAPENGIEDYEPKQIIIREDEIGDCMYVVLEGNVEVSIRGGMAAREITIATLKKGDFFGEQALLPEGTGRRNATVKALHASRVFKIDKKYVLLNVKKDVELEESEDITEINPVLPPHEVRDLIKDMRLFQSLNRDELLSIDDWAEIVTVGPGEFVIKESQPGDYLYVVLDGIVEVFTFDDADKIAILARHKRGSYFGEQAMLSEEDRKRSAYVRTDDQARLIQIPKQYFRIILKRDSELETSLREIGEKQKEQIDKLQSGG